MKLIFFGTPPYSVYILDALQKYFRHINDGSEVVAVVTQKPKPAGRDHRISYSAVDTWAHKRNVPIYFSAEEVVNKNIFADVGVLASYGEIISKKVLGHFPFGIINFHPSLLPAWRGASPVQASIVSGEKVTGGTFIKLDAELDHGPIVGQFKEDIKDSDTTETLRNRLFDRAGEIIPGLLDAYTKGKINIKKQDHGSASYCRQIKKDESFIPGKYLKKALDGKTVKAEWTIPFMKVDNDPYNLQPTTYNINNFVRAMNPWPQAWTEVKLRPVDKEKKRLKIISAHLENLASETLHLTLDIVQLEGKNQVTWQQFIQGYPSAQF